MRIVDRKIAVALLISQEGKIFQGQKDPELGGVYSDGYWHIPGGGIEEGESAEEALIREVYEETGLDIKDVPIELIDSDGVGEAEKMSSTCEKILVRMKFFTYRIQLPYPSTEAQIELHDDLVTYKWTDPSELSMLKLTPPSVALFTKLGYLK